MASSHQQLEIPEIDMALSDDKVATELFAALTTTGFATLTHHGVSKALRERAFAASKAFFSLPLKAKMDVAYKGHQSNQGYIGIGKETHDDSTLADYKETYDINVNDSQPWPTAENNTRNLSLQTFQQDMEEYFLTMDKLHLTIMRLIEVGLGIPKNYMVDRCNERHENLRLLHYPELEMAAGDRGDFGPRSRGAVHTDFGTITLLIQDGVGGLRVKCRDDTWIDAKPVPDAIIVNVGDMLQRWTNGILKANPHQVVEVSGDTCPERYSIAFFCNANRETILEPLKQCVSEERPTQYEPVKAFDYITMRLTQTIEHS